MPDIDVTLLYRPRRDRWGAGYWARLQELALWSDTDVPALYQQIQLAGFAVPELRWFREHVRRIRRADASPPWQLERAERSDPAVVVMVSAWWYAHGASRPLSRDEAEWITAVHGVAPDLSAKSLFWAAKAYELAVRDQRPTTGLDAQLALAPWRGQKEAAVYRSLVDLTRIPPTGLTLRGQVRDRVGDRRERRSSERRVVDDLA